MPNGSQCLGRELPRQAFRLARRGPVKPKPDLPGVHSSIKLGVAPFIGQNAGAKRFDRVRQAVSFANRFCVIGGLIEAVALALVAPWLVGLFASDPEVIRLAELYLYVVPISYALAGIVAVAMSTWNALAMPLAASIIGLARSLLVTVPFIMAGAWVAGIEGVWVGNSLASVAVGAAAWWWLRRTVARKAADMPDDRSTTTFATAK